MNRYEGSERTRDQPSKFYGLTERGVQVLDEFKYLRGISVLRAAHDNTVKPDRVQRHENTPRPELPASVADALEFDETDVNELESSDQPNIFADKATDGEKGTFDDLFE